MLVTGELESQFAVPFRSVSYEGNRRIFGRTGFIAKSLEISLVYVWFVVDVCQVSSSLDGL